MDALLFITPVFIGAIIGLAAVAGAIVAATWWRKRLVAANPMAVPHASELSPEARQLLRPFLNFEGELRKLLEQHSDHVAIRVIAQEAMKEAGELQRAALRLIQSREEIRRLKKPASEAKLALEKLQAQLDQRPDSEALQTAVSSQRDQVAELDRVLERLTPIDDRIREAHAALSALKSRISVSAADMKAEGIDEEGLQYMVQDMRALEKSFDETESMLKERN